MEIITFYLIVFSIFYASRKYFLLSTSKRKQCTTKLAEQLRATNLLNQLPTDERRSIYKSQLRKVTNQIIKAIDSQYTIFL